MARLTGLEPATPGVTGRYSNQLSYNRAILGPANRAWGAIYAGPLAASSAPWGKNHRSGAGMNSP